MAKSMARIEARVVVNMEWCSDDTPETDTLKSPDDHPVGIGDTYTDGKFYRDGVEILTPLEAALAEAAALRQEIAELDEAYTEGVNSI